MKINLLKTVRFVFLYTIAWIIIFQALRIIFLVFNKRILSNVPFSLKLKSMWVGSRMDFSVAAYYTLPIILFLILALVIPFFRKPTLFKIFTISISIITGILCLVDMGSFNNWGFRLDTTPLQFLQNPVEAWASISHMPVVLILLGIGLLFFLLTYGWKFFFKIFFPTKFSPSLLSLTVLIVSMAASIIPIRGGFQLAPMNQSTVYFSSNAKANQCAINPVWNFLYSLNNSRKIMQNSYLSYNTIDAKQIVDSMYIGAGDTVNMQHVFTHIPNQILLIVWESFTEKVVGKKFSDVEITPGINNLLKQGIFFSNNYASGDRTNKGLSAILSAYPALPHTSIIQYPNKSVKLPTLASLLKSNGYKTSFYYGGEPEFANIKSYLLNGGFDNLIAKDSFSAIDMNSKWGAHDGVVADKLFNYIRNQHTKTFTTWLTLTSHEPFETPVKSILQGKDDESMFLSSLHYTDGVITSLIEKMKVLPQWENTLVLLVGDHGHALPRVQEKQLDFRTPMLWLGGCLKEPFVYMKISSQVDIATTLASQLGQSNTFPFGKNLFAKKIYPWAFFDFNDGFGLVDSTGYVVYDNIGKQPIQSNSPRNADLTRRGKALMLHVYNDFIKK